MYRLILLCLICAVNGFKDRIIGGQNEKIENAPYQVDIMSITRQHICGGSILSENYVLTAGHCIDKPRGFYYIRVGSADSPLKDRNLAHSISDIIRHEGFTTDKYARNENDILLLKVTPPIKLDNKKTKAIQLINRPVRPGDVGFLTGWGSTIEGQGAAQTLQSLRVKIISNKKCEDNYRDFKGLKQYNFCAEHPSKSKDMCNGDSGGPLVVNNKLAGIVSWSYGCAYLDRPGVYVDVFKYVDWIRKHMV